MDKFTVYLLVREQSQEMMQYLSERKEGDGTGVRMFGTGILDLVGVVFEEPAKVPIHFPTPSRKGLEQIGYAHQEKWVDVFDIRLGDDTVLTYVRSVDVHKSALYIGRKGKK